MARATHTAIRNMGDFATSIHWDVQIVSFPNAVATALTSDEFNLRADSTDMPRSTGQSTEIMIRGLKHKQPGIYMPQGTLTMTMWETIDSKISTFIRDWRNAIFDPETGSQNVTEDVVAVIRLVRLDRSLKPIYEYILHGAYLEDNDPGGQLQGQSPDPLKPTLTISYDTFDEGPL